MRPLPPNVRLREDITTPRLVLEPAGPRHLDDLWESILSSHGELAPWMVWAVEPDKGRSAEFFEHCERSWMAESGGPWEFAILKDGRAIGGVGLHGSTISSRGRRSGTGCGWMRRAEAS